MLRWYASRRRWWDLATFSLGWFLAVMYHIAHMHPGGLASSQVLGLGGAAWRTLDIVSAQSLLARTIGHALGGRSAAVGLLSNAAFPCLVALHAQVYGAISLATTARLLLLVAGAILGAKLILEGAHTVPAFDTPGARKAGLLFLAAFVVFPLPEVWPLLYWLFHSVWHVCLASAYAHLYRHLESSAPRPKQA
ncbi:hypothetical protein H632_c3403p0 [Helicosporidium sp. ATCC 50920]|nr:hypothetical protein H632_c3403p0 [Helicosporidium sp. ATCC 50920]|eukprot:KDD72393.1 hypothetical protein H632_c3403p0 [Helicosporidium sp. ATCC 50920]